MTIRLRSNMSPIRPPMGATNRNGIIAAKVTMPTQPEPDDLSNTIHELATMVVHIAALEAMLANQVNLNSRCRSDANCGIRAIW